MLQFRSLLGRSISPAIALMIAFSACTKKENAETASAPAAANPAVAGAPDTQPAGLQAPQGAPQDAPHESDVTELKIVELKEGSGEAAAAGKIVKVHYTGWLTNGKKFDSSLDRGDPLRFPLGAGRVIPGWDKGLVGMKVGGKRRLVIPPQMAYGAAGAGGVIPPNSTLVFEVELMGVEKN